MNAAGLSGMSSKKQLNLNSRVTSEHAPFEGRRGSNVGADTQMMMMMIII